ncbi:hypothetical protein [Methanococcoides sp. FTZ1]|uniref:hypothetical protein n=1 Tax=Methanococcoides sp. FTZ1 TaxID=3439061 RepID=UPI003F870DDA
MDENYVVITNDNDFVNRTAKCIVSEDGGIVEMHIIYSSLEEILPELMDTGFFVA